MNSDATSTAAQAPSGRTIHSGPELVAGLAVLLRRYTDRNRVAIGYQVAEQSDTVTLELEMGDDPSFAELLRRVHAGLQSSGPGIGTALADTALDGVVEGDEVRALLNGATPAASALRSHLDMVLHAGQADPERSIDRLPLLSDAERTHLLVELNDTRAPYPQQCLHELIAAQAQRTPQAIAVQFEDQQLSYAELDASANRLARHLSQLGVGPEVLVGVGVERSAEMLVALLGIMKAGGAYVPIDPAYPLERQEFMLRSSQAPVLITQERLRKQLPSQGLRVVCLDTDAETIAALSADPLPLEADPEQLAYVIYTSGSTGTPKGVQIPHRALVNFLTTMSETPALSAGDVLVAVTTLSFDIAGLELYLPLVTGARVVIASAHTAGDPRALAPLLASSGATIMQATPTTWRMLLDSGWTGRPGMKALCGGEALPRALADRLIATGLELWNMYGPTETTIWSTCARLREGDPLTIGRPIANTRLYILDAHNQPVPVGVAGQLWIGGDGLARGYRGRPDLTDERFIPDPFLGRASDAESPPPRETRMYATGDLARYRPDGAIDFLGRIDHQVKVRGFRIELGEIETVLARRPEVADAVVVARGHDAEAELHAYVILAGEPVAAHELRTDLAQTLPPYMIPSTVTALQSFPLTPNGKVDRKVLPEPARERSGERALVEPRTPLERRLAQIWERELEVSPIGVTDNFFDLGVTSIVTATLFAAIEHELGNDLPLGAIFKAPTIEALARLIEGAGDTSRWTSLVPIQAEGSRPPIFCMHGGAGTILHLALLARDLGPDQPFYGLQSRGLYGGASPLLTVEAMATHYLSEMRQVQPNGPWYLGGYCFGAIVAHEIACRLQAQGEEVKLLVMFNGPSPAWIKRWGWHGNQPSWLAKHPRAPRPTARQQRRRRLESFVRRAAGAMRQPRKLWTGALWYLWRPRVRIALALGRPIPEQLRETYFLELHQKSERAYEAGMFKGEIVTFYGEDLYEDPALGWAPHATAGVRSFAVPGEHTGNRDAMKEPHAAFVAEHLSSYLKEHA